MRLVSQSTRMTIRTITVIAAFTALVFALLAPLAGSAHAEDEPTTSFITFTLDGTSDKVEFVLEKDGTGAAKADITLPGYEWLGDGQTDGPVFHVSCSATLLGTFATVTSSALTPFDEGDEVEITNFFIHRPLGGDNVKTCNPATFGDEPDEDPTDPTETPTETEPAEDPTEPTETPEPTETEDVGVLDQVDEEVKVLDEVAVADDELAATGGELTRLALLAALIAALGAMLLMATEAAPRAARRTS